MIVQVIKLRIVFETCYIAVLCQNYACGVAWAGFDFRSSDHGLEMAPLPLGSCIVI